MAKFNFTLLLYVSVVLALAASSNADSFGPHRRDHANLGRLLKKRAPLDILGNAQAEGSGATSQAVQPTQSASAVSQPTTANPVQTAPGAASASTAASPSLTSGGVLGSVVGGLLPSSSSTTSSSAVSTAMPSTSDRSSSTPQTSDSVSQTAIATTPSKSVLYLTTSASGTPTSTPDSTSSSSGMSHTAMTVLIIIAACVGAAVIAWTIIRKWKFRPSSDFEGRMQPIDWQPGAGAGDENAGLPGQSRPLSRSSSFHSGSAHGHGDNQMRGAGGYGTTPLNPIPDHDFTAGPAHFAPVGGYADLARGPSPQPMMHEPLEQAPSINRPVQYDQYGVPLHHGYSGY